jgi:hypothetical protein
MKNTQKGARCLRQPNKGLSSRVFSEYFCSDMSHRPSKVNKAHKHCYGLLKQTPLNTNQSILQNLFLEENRALFRRGYSTVCYN